VAVSDDRFALKVYRYPTIKKSIIYLFLDSDYIELLGHSNHINNIKFSNDD